MCGSQWFRILLSTSRSKWNRPVVTPHYFVLSGVVSSYVWHIVWTDLFPPSLPSKSPKDQNRVRPKWWIAHWMHSFIPQRTFARDEGRRKKAAMSAFCLLPQSPSSRLDENLLERKEQQKSQEIENFLLNFGAPAESKFLNNCLMFSLACVLVKKLSFSFSICKLLSSDLILCLAKKEYLQCHHRISVWISRHISIIHSAFVYFLFINKNSWRKWWQQLTKMIKKPDKKGRKCYDCTKKCCYNMKPVILKEFFVQMARLFAPKKQHKKKEKST